MAGAAVLSDVEQLLIGLERELLEGIPFAPQLFIPRIDRALLSCSRIYREMQNTAVEEDWEAVVVSLLYLKQEIMEIQTNEVPYHAPRMAGGGHPGQPPYNITQNQLEFLIGLKLPATAIARIIGVSERTVHRRMSQYGMSIRVEYSRMTDNTLDDEVRSLKMMHPNAGYRLMTALLYTRGHRVQQHRVRASLDRVDPMGVAARLSHNRAINHRVYFVPHPIAVWHIDGNMSLVRWGIIVHGSIDGYSRLITYLSCSTSNTADTVLQYFLDVCRDYGIPSRVHSDHGGENFDVAQFMLYYRGVNRSSHITGRSTRNQRIERLWRDVFEKCLSPFLSVVKASYD